MEEPPFVFTSLASSFVNAAFEIQLKKQQKHLLFLSVTRDAANAALRDKVRPLNPTPPAFVKRLPEAAAPKLPNPDAGALVSKLQS